MLEDRSFEGIWICEINNRSLVRKGQLFNLFQGPFHQLQIRQTAKQRFCIKNRSESVERIFSIAVSVLEETDFEDSLRCAQCGEGVVGEAPRLPRYAAEGD